MISSVPGGRDFLSAIDPNLLTRTDATLNDLGQQIRQVLSTEDLVPKIARAAVNYANDVLARSVGDQSSTSLRSGSPIAIPGLVFVDLVTATRDQILQTMDRLSNPHNTSAENVTLTAQLASAVAGVAQLGSRSGATLFSGVADDVVADGAPDSANWKR